jgi:hypothetical protein
MRRPQADSMNVYRDGSAMKPEIHPDHLDRHSGWLVARYEIVIEREPQAIWQYVHDPRTWTASNPDEHMGLVFYNDENRPKTGAPFYQTESVSGVRADLRGHILYADPPRVCIWNGVARYRLWGVIPFAVPEAGVVRQDPVTRGDVVVAHGVSTSPEYPAWPSDLLLLRTLLPATRVRTAHLQGTPLFQARTREDDVIS